MRRFLIFSLLLTLIACKQNTYIIPQKEMVDVLVDIHLIDGIIASNLTEFDYREKKIQAYESIYLKFNIDQAQFDSSLVYYSAKPEMFVQIYDSVITHLMKIETNVQTGKYYQADLLALDVFLENEFPQDTSARDSMFREFWNKRRNFNLSEDTAKLAFNFHIPIDTVKGDFYLFKADVLFQPDSCVDEAMIEMKLAYKDSSEKTVRLLLVQDTIPHPYRLVLPVDSGKMPLTVSGGFSDTTYCLSQSRIELSNVRLYEMGAPEIIEQLRYKGLFNKHHD